MKHKIFITLFFWLITVTSSAQLSLTIEVYGLRNNTGKIYLELKDEKEEQVAGISRVISDNKCIIVIKNLKPGRYAFSFFHDENNNEKLDVNWLGIPKEGFGFSNNPSIIFGPPSFDKTLFNLYNSKYIRCKIKYY